MKRFLKILLLVVVIFVIYCAFIFFVPHGSARRKLAEYKKQLIAQGEKLDLGSLAQAPKTGASNIAKEFLAISRLWRSSNAWDFTPPMKMVGPGKAEIGYTNISQVFMATYETNKFYAAQLRRIFPDAVLDFGLDYSQGYDLPLPHLTEIRVTSQLLSITAMQALHNNDLEEAALDLIAGADLIHSWSSEPLRISSLVRNIYVRFLIGTTWEGLQHGGWSDLQLAEVQAAWERVNLFGSMDVILSGEGALGIDFFAQARKAKAVDEVNPSATPSGTSSFNFADWINHFFAGPKIALSEAYERYPKFWAWKSKWSFDEELCTVQLVTTAVDMSRRIQTNGAFVPSFQALTVQSSNIIKLYPEAKNRFMLLTEQPGFIGDASTAEFYQNILKKTAMVETARRLVIAAIALERYHLRHQAWPETLDQLTPDFLAQVPIDFMDGQPLRYRRMPDGYASGPFSLYSVGLDGKDDGGVGGPAAPQLGLATPIPGGPGFPINWTETSDIVWPQVATIEYMQHLTNRLHNSISLTNKPPPAQAK